VRVPLLALTLLGRGALALAAPAPDSSAVRADSVAAFAAAGADTLAFAFAPGGSMGLGVPAPERLVEPAGLAVDAFGRVFVADAALHRLQIFDARGAWLATAGTLGSDPGQLRRPGAVTTLGQAGIAVLDRENFRVESYDLLGRRSGTLVDLADPALVDQVGRVDPVTLAADRGGAVYLADAERDRVLVFDFSGRYLRALGGFGARPGSFRGLRALAVTRRGELLAADRDPPRLQRLEPSGRAAVAWPLPAGIGHAGMALAVDDSGRVALADESSGRLWMLDREGRLLAALGGLGGPRALAFAPDGTLLVAEARAGRVSRWTLRPARAPAGGGR